MNKIIKVIDFLIKKANKEELPKKVKFHNEIFVAGDEYYGEHINQEEDSDGSRRCLFEGWVLGKILNDEIEIIEEDKEIRPLKLNDSDVWTGKSDGELIVEKINEIIKTLNELKKGK